MEIAGGKILHVDDAALPRGTTLAVADLFFNTPARRKFLRAESTELAHVTALVTHYALAHPEKHFELRLGHAHHPFRAAGDPHRRAHLPDLRQGHAGAAAARGRRDAAGARRPARAAAVEEGSRRAARDPGVLRLSGFYSKPELQKLNRNSIYIFVNKRLIRDRLLMHAITEAYRNVIPPTSFPVVLLFLEMPPEEVDVNVHPAKTEVRFRQQSLIHDFVRDSLRTALIQARPAAGFLAALDNSPAASPSLMPPADLAAARRAGTLRSAGFRSAMTGDEPTRAAEPFQLTPRCSQPGSRQAALRPGRLQRGRLGDQQAWGEAAAALFEPARGSRARRLLPSAGRRRTANGPVRPRRPPRSRPSRRPPI